jgi:hypothetical protein
MQAKFHCQFVQELQQSKHEKVGNVWRDTGVQEKYAEVVYFTPVYAPPDQPDHPNHEWFKSTPSGELRMQIDNPAAWGHFVPGKDYHLTFLPSE